MKEEQIVQLLSTKMEKTALKLFGTKWISKNPMNWFSTLYLWSTELNRAGLLFFRWAT